MKQLQHIFFAAFLLIASVSTALATESAQSLAARLQSQILGGAGISMKFTVVGQGRVSLTADLAANRVRMESPDMLIVSDSKTVWNVQKHSNRVTIDNVSGPSSAFSDPSSLFRFADNYTATIVSNRGSTYVLQLTPNSRLAEILKSVGGMSTLTLTLRLQPSTIVIQSARASSTKGSSNVSGFSISSLKTVRASDFVFSPTAGMKVIDLRED